MNPTTRKQPILRYWVLAWLTLGFNISTHAAQTITYYHWDALGSPVAATDEAGNVRWREEYLPYGEKIQNQPQSQTNSRWYTGHPHDNATGLTYMGARWYDPVVGRFMAIDPKDFAEGNPHSFNRYNYANNNPFRNLDPDGKWSTNAHNYFIKEAFSGMLSEKIMGYIMEGSALADAPVMQLSHDYIHSMWGSTGSKVTMQMLRADYISARLQNFNASLALSTYYRALGYTWVADILERQAWQEYGKALHPIMDSTSPVHNTQWKVGDAIYHGDYSQTQEDESVAPKYRDVTIQRMRDINGYINTPFMY